MSLFLSGLRCHLSAPSELPLETRHLLAYQVIVTRYYFSGLFTVIRPYTVRFSEIENPTVRFGAVLKKRKSYGAVRCGFQIL